MGDKLKILGGVTILGLSTFISTCSVLELHQQYETGKIAAVEDVGTEQLNNFLSNLSLALANKDTKKIQEYIKPNGFIMEKNDYERFLDYFDTAEKRVKFIRRIQRQYQYLEKGVLTTDTMYYLAEEDENLFIKVNTATVNLRVNSVADTMDVKTYKGNKTYEVQDSEVSVKNQLPIYDVLECDIEGNIEKCEVDYIGDFCDMSYGINLQTEIDKFIFKHGAGLAILADIPKDNCKLYINGKYAHTTLDKGLTRIDTLNSGDKVHIKYKTNTSNKIVASPTTNTVKFYFSSAKSETDNKSSVTNKSELIGIVNDLFAKINNGVNTSNKNVLNPIVDSSVKEGSKNFMKSLISDYNKIEFDRVDIKNYKQSGETYKVNGKYSYSFENKEGTPGTRTSTFTINIKNGKITYFSLN